MKRVVAFLDTFDEIPNSAKYLYSRKIEVPTEETDEQKAARIISSTPESHMQEPAIFYMHYYEVEEMDFEELMESGFSEKTPENKIKEFLNRYKK